MHEYVTESGEVRGLIHFVYSEGKQYRIICGASPDCLVSNDTRAVTCPVCIQDYVFEASRAELLSALARKNFVG